MLLKLRLSTVALLPYVLIGCAGLSPNETDELATLFVGTFDTTEIPGSEESRIVDRRVRIDAPDLGEFVFYQQINRGDDLELYRQRIFVWKVDQQTNEISQSAYTLRDAERYIDARQADFVDLSLTALASFMPIGCEQIWTRNERGFQGFVDPDSCRVVSTRTGKVRSIEAESQIEQQTLALAERGFDPQTGEQLFGTPAGQYTLLGRRPEGRDD